MFKYGTRVIFTVSYSPFLCETRHYDNNNIHISVVQLKLQDGEVVVVTLKVSLKDPVNINTAWLSYVPKQISY